MYQDENNMSQQRHGPSYQKLGRSRELRLCYGWGIQTVKKWTINIVCCHLKLRRCNKAVACSAEAVSINMEPHKAEKTAQNQWKPTHHWTTKTCRHRHVNTKTPHSIQSVVFNSAAGLRISLNPMILQVEVIMTFIFTNSPTASAPDSQLSSSSRKLMHEAAQKPLLCGRRFKFQVLLAVVQKKKETDIEHRKRDSCYELCSWGDLSI